MRSLKLLFAFTLFTLVFSCNKPDEDDEPTTTTGALDRFTFKLGADTSTTFFDYDAAGKVRKVKWVYFSPSFGTDSITVTLTRDGNGKIVQMTEQEGATQIPRQTWITYQPGSSMLRSVVNKTGSYYKDSSVFTYSGAIITQNRYSGNVQTGLYEFTDISEYTVTEGNLTKTRSYSVDPGGIVQQTGQADYSYDTRKAPISISFEEVFLMGLDEYWFKNNITQIVYTDMQMPSFSETITYTHSYNSVDRPATAQVLIQPGSQAGSMTFTYK